MSLKNVLKPWDTSRLPCHQAEWHPRHEDAAHLSRRSASRNLAVQQY